MRNLNILVLFVGVSCSLFAQDRLSLFISIGQISMSLESYWIIENVYVWNIVLLVIYWMITISYVEEIEEMSV